MNFNDFGYLAAESKTALLKAITEQVPTDISQSRQPNKVNPRNLRECFGRTCTPVEQQKTDHADRDHYRCELA